MKFQAFKVSTDGRQDRWGYVTGLTHEQARDTERFPLGPLQDERGKFIWSYAMQDR